MSARTILRKKNKARMQEIDTNVDTTIARSQVRIQYKRYKEYLNTATEKRQTFQDELAQARASEGKNRIAKEIERMKRVEKQRDSARRIRKMNGTLRLSKGLPMVIVPGNNGTEEEVVEKKIKWRKLY